MAELNLDQVHRLKSVISDDPAYLLEYKIEQAVEEIIEEQLRDERLSVAREALSLLDDLEEQVKTTNAALQLIVGEGVPE